MRCDEFEARLNQVLDDRRPLSSADDLQAHLRQCGGCREVARSYEALLAGLGYQVVPPVPAWLTDRVMDSLTPAARQRDHRRLLRFPHRHFSNWHFPHSGVAVSLAAAVLLLVVGLVWLNDSRRVRGNNSSGVENTSVAQAHGTSPDRRQVERATVRTAESAASAVIPPQEVDETSPEKRNPAERNPEERNTEYSQAFPSTDWGPAGAEWAQDVADGLQPVTQPTMGAISGFLNLWGIGEQGHRS